MALKINHYNKEVRQAISQYSPVHAKRIQLEEHSVFLIENLWRSRWMTPGYRKRYQQLIIHELEMKLKLNYWNMRTRRELAYYAKSKWRPHFVFENDCALKIQKQFKKAKIIWKWQAPQRAKYSLLASEIYRQYNKTPLKRSIREEVYRLVRHKYVSRKHAIHKLTPTMKHQDHAHRVIWKAWKAYKFRQDLDRSIKLRQERRHQEYLRSTIKIQTLWRIYLAKKLKIILTNHQQKKIHAAVVIQRYIRHRFRTFHYNVRRLLAQQQRQRYQLQYFLHFSLLSLWRKYLQRKLYKARVIAAANTIRRYYRIWNRQKQRIRYLHRMATRIQVMYRNYCIQHLAGVTKKLLKIRKIIDYSVVGTELLTSLHEEPPSAAAGKGRGGGAGAGGGGGGMDGSSCYYKSPGIKANTLPYQTLLNQHTVYCNQSFTATDAILLGAVLRNPLCRIRRLIFHSINGSNPSFEFDLLSSFTHCHSLRLIAILGGTWPISFIKKLIETIQLENPLIQTLLLESLHQVKSLEINQIVQSSSFLLLDFFNYSVPGIRYLSLHGLNLVDDDLKLLADGLRVNTSLTHFILSLNLIEDPGFLLLLNALIQNHHKSSLMYLDLSWNLICLNEGTVRLLDSYPSTGARALTTYPLPPTASKHKEFPLTINLLHNRITVPYHPIDEDRTDLVVQTVEEEGPSRDGQRRGQGGATMKSKKMFNLSNSPKNPNKENKSKFKSALQQKISSKSQFMSKTTT